jgi:hypothetical protein
MTLTLIRHYLCAAITVLALAFSGPGALQPANGAAPAQQGAPAGQATVGAVGHIQPLRPGFNFPRQTLRYEAEYRFWNAGVGAFKVERTGNLEHISGTVDSTGVVALLFKVQDRFESYFDARTLCSQKLIKHTEEGAHRRDTQIVFDYARGKSVLDETNLKTNQKKREEHDIPSCVTDVVSGILYVASLPLQEGATYAFPLNDGGKTVVVQAHVEAKEEVKIPAGTFKTIRVGPEGDYGPLKNRGRIWIWYTDDAQHLPVQMKAKLFWGSLTVYLAGSETQK